MEPHHCGCPADHACAHVKLRKPSTKSSGCLLCTYNKPCSSSKHAQTVLSSKDLAVCNIITLARTSRCLGRSIHTKRLNKWSAYLNRYRHHVSSARPPQGLRQYTSHGGHEQQAAAERTSKGNITTHLQRLYPHTAHD